MKIAKNSQYLKLLYMAKNRRCTDSNKYSLTIILLEIVYTNFVLEFGCFWVAYMLILSIMEILENLGNIEYHSFLAVYSW